jgi:hypothetical protein
MKKNFLPFVLSNEKNVLPCYLTLGKNVDALLLCNNFLPSKIYTIKTTKCEIIRLVPVTRECWLRSN